MKADGAIIIDGRQVADTHQCCHCDQHFVSVKGSGIRRGFCMNCMHVTCGAPECHPCIPFLKKLEQMEQKDRARREG